jgi:uncharacterized protein
MGSFYQDLEPAQRAALSQELRSRLFGCDAIVFAYLFGSFITGAPFQDIDIALFMDTKRLPREQHETFVENLAQELSAALRQPFDISVINEAPDPFKASVFTEGELLFSRNETLRTDMLEASSLACLSDEGVSRQSLLELVFS